MYESINKSVEYLLQCLFCNINSNCSDKNFRKRIYQSFSDFSKRSFTKATNLNFKLPCNIDIVPDLQLIAEYLCDVVVIEE